MHERLIKIIIHLFSLFSIVSNNEEALEAVENFAVIVGQLDQSSEELCSLFITKANDESKLPTG